MTILPTTALLTPSDIATVVTATTARVTDHYVFPELSRKIVDRVRAKVENGEYDACTSPADLARAVTADLQAVNGDKHLRLLFHEDEIVDAQDESAFLASYTREAAACGYGVRQVRRLAGNVAYLDLAPQLFHPLVAGDAIVAAMRLVASADSLVIDLRGCRGGSPETVSLICSYLFAEETHLTDQLTNDPADLHQRWTTSWVPGPKIPEDTPVKVLTSATTFSGGEDLAYTLQQSGRATVVGETTGGGAHPREGFKVHAHLEATVPVAYSRNPRSGTNWEGVGVVPDVAVSEAEALAVALGMVGGRP